MKLLFKIFLIVSFIFNIGLADEIKIFDFTKAEISNLQVRKVRGADNETFYTVGNDKNGNFLKSVADNAASGLGKEIKIDLNKTPFINITWKVEKDLPGIKEDTKKGHDFAARVFVIKKTGVTLLSNRAINYVFSSNNEVGFNFPSSILPDSSYTLIYVARKPIDGTDVSGRIIDSKTNANFYSGFIGTKTGVAFHST